MGLRHRAARRRPGRIGACNASAHRFAPVGGATLRARYMRLVRLLCGSTPGGLQGGGLARAKAARVARLPADSERAAALEPPPVGESFVSG